MTCISLACEEIEALRKQIVKYKLLFELLAGIYDGAHWWQYLICVWFIFSNCLELRDIDIDALVDAIMVNSDVEGADWTFYGRCNVFPKINLCCSRYDIWDGDKSAVTNVRTRTVFLNFYPISVWMFQALLFLSTFLATWVCRFRLLEFGYVHSFAAYNMPNSYHLSSVTSASWTTYPYGFSREYLVSILDILILPSWSVVLLSDCVASTPKFTVQDLYNFAISKWYEGDSLIAPSTTQHYYRWCYSKSSTSSYGYRYNFVKFSLAILSDLWLF